MRTRLDPVDLNVHQHLLVAGKIELSQRGLILQGFTALRLGWSAAALVALADRHALTALLQAQVVRRFLPGSYRVSQLPHVAESM